jgi:carboxylesterase type B
MLYEQSPDSVQGCNFGLRDQKVALTWISKNIRAFGGDPKKISIGGQSAGGCSVYIHAVEAKLRPETPLFRNAVIQSGAVGCLGPISIDQADERWETLSKHAGITTQDPVARLTDLREKSPSELMLACKALGWMVFPLVNDKRTLAFTDRFEPLLVDLGTVYNNASQTSQHEPIAIMLGEVDCEVMHPFISYPQQGRVDAKEMILIFLREAFGVTRFQASAVTTICEQDSKQLSQRLQLRSMH